MFIPYRRVLLDARQLGVCHRLAYLIKGEKRTHVLCRLGGNARVKRRSFCHGFLLYLAKAIVWQKAVAAKGACWAADGRRASRHRVVGNDSLTEMRQSYAWVYTCFAQGGRRAAFAFLERGLQNGSYH